MAMHEGAPVPFYALVGHTGSPPWTNAAVGFVAVYHRLVRGETIETAVEAMRMASGDNGFILQYGQHLQESWTQHIQRIGVAEPLRRAAEIIEAVHQRAQEGTQK